MKKNTNTRFPLLLAVFSVLVFGLCAPVFAAEEKSSLLLPPTTGKEIYMLFHKLTGKRPEFIELIKNSDTYKNADPVMQATLLQEEKAKLDTQFATVDPNLNSIIIRSAVNIRSSIGAFRGLRVTLPGGPDRPNSGIYFPYNWGGMNFALIPDQFEPFLDIPMKQEELTAASSKLTNNSATLVLEMQPLKGDKTSPLRLDGLDQWLLMTKIMAVTYYNQNLQVIWAWQAAGHRRQGRSALEDLKK